MSLLAWLAAPALAGSIVVVNGEESVVITDDAAPVVVAPPVPPVPPVPVVEAVVVDDDEDEELFDRWDRDPNLYLGSTVSFLDGGAAQSGYGRGEGDRDSYVEGYGRLSPCGCWVGRAGAGVDVFGDGALDLNLGLFIGASGQPGTLRRAPTMTTTPQAGTQIAIGVDGRHLLARYTWLAGLGGGELDDLLTENQLMIGARLTPAIEIYGEVLYFDPGAYDPQTAVGLGARLAL